MFNPWFSGQQVGNFILSMCDIINCMHMDWYPWKLGLNRCMLNFHRWWELLLSCQSSFS